jgi:hypothetical protein
MNADDVDEPRTKVERQADFGVGILVGSFITLLLCCRINVNELGNRLHWFVFIIPALFIIGCGYLNYRFGSRLWSRN